MYDNREEFCKPNHRPHCPVLDVDGFMSNGKQFDIDITLPEDNRNVIYGTIKNCYKEPIKDAVVKLIEIVIGKHGSKKRIPVSHTFTDKYGEFVFGPLCPDKTYAIDIWVNDICSYKFTAISHRDTNCLKGKPMEICGCIKPEPKCEEYEEKFECEKHEEKYEDKFEYKKCECEKYEEKYEPKKCECEKHEDKCEPKKCECEKHEDKCEPKKCECKKHEEKCEPKKCECEKHEDKCEPKKCECEKYEDKCEPKFCQPKQRWCR